MKAKLLSLSDLKWVPTDEEDKEFLFNVQGHYRIAAFILQYQFTQMGEEQIKSGFKKDAGEDFAFLKEKLAAAEDQENLVEQIRTEIKSPQVEQIIAILDF